MLRLYGLVGIVVMIVGPLGCDDCQQCAAPPEDQPVQSSAEKTEPPKVLYEQDFESVKVGEVPEDMIVLDGEFTVREFEGNKVLELPGQPLDAFAVLFGPYALDNVELTARVYTEHNRRRYPRFGIGLGAAGGVKLRIDAAADLLTLYDDDLPLTSVAYTWPAGQWLRLKMRLTRLDDNKWLYRGKAWPAAETEPTDWMIHHETDVEPIEGEASVWGTPYADRPIRFDDLRFVELPSNSE